METLTLGVRLKKLRGVRKLPEVAKLVGCSQSALYSYESGENVPNVAVAYRLAKLYGVTVEDLIGDEKELRVSEAMAAAYYSADRMQRAASVIARAREIHKKLENLVKDEGEKLDMIDGLLGDLGGGGKEEVNYKAVGEK